MRPVLLAASLLVLGAPVAAAETGAHPRVIVDRPTLDLGRVVRGQIAEGSFLVRNLGGAPLHLLSVKPGCSCTVASYDEVIEPGKTGRITARVETKDFRGPVDRGISLTTDDPDRPSVALWIHVDVAGSVQLLPRGSLDLRPGHAAVPEVARLLVRRDPGEQGELRLTDASVDAPWLRVTTRRVDGPEPETHGLPAALPGDVLLEVSVAGDVPEGKHRQTLRFATGLPTEPTVEVPVGVFVAASLRIAGHEVRFGPREPDGARRAVVLVAIREDLGDTPLSVATPEGMDAVIETAGARRHHVRLTWRGQTPPAGSVVFRAGDASRTLPVVAEP